MRSIKAKYEVCGVTMRWTLGKNKLILILDLNFKGTRTYADFSVGDSLVASPQNREGAYIYRFSHDFVKTELSFFGLKSTCSIVT